MTSAAPDTAHEPPPIVGLADLQAHLLALSDDPTLPLDAPLLDRFELQLLDANIPPLLPLLLPPLSRILKSTTQDPTPLLSLAVKLLSPLTFTSALAVADPPSLVAALRSPLPGANLLALAVIHKAAATPSDVAILSTLPDLVEELIRRWLESPEVEVGQRATRLLGDLLETDCEVVPQQLDALSNGSHDSPDGNELIKRCRPPGHGRLWRLLFLGRPNLQLMRSLCSSDSATGQSTHTLQQVTIAQGRLLSLLPKLAALDMRPISQSSFPDIFPVPPAAAAATIGPGLLQWAALSMVDRSDVLMHRNLIDFYESFVGTMRLYSLSPDCRQLVANLVKSAAQDDNLLEAALRSLPDRTVDDEADALRQYVAQLLA